MPEDVGHGSLEEPLGGLSLGVIRGRGGASEKHRMGAPVFGTGSSVYKLAICV